MSTEGTAAAATTAPAATSTTTTPTPSATSGAVTSTQTDWTAGFNDEMKGYVQTKGFKAPQDVLDSYRNFEKLQGVPAERLLRLPEDMSSPEARAVFERLGAPKEAKDYAIEIPKEHGDTQLADWMRGVAHKNGFTQRQVEGLVKDWNARSAANIKAMTDAQQLNLTNADQNLKKEWGQAYEQNKNMVDQGAIALGMGEKELSALGAALGPDKAMQLLLKLATATGESSFVAGGRPNNGVLAPDQAKSKISELMGDTSFIKRLNAGEIEAGRQWDLAHQMAFPGVQNL